MTKKEQLTIADVTADHDKWMIEFNKQCASDDKMWFKVYILTWISCAFLIAQFILIILMAIYHYKMKGLWAPILSYSPLVVIFINISIQAFLIFRQDKKRRKSFIKRMNIRN